MADLPRRTLRERERQDLLDLRSVVQENEGLPAIEDELVGEGVVREIASVWVKVTRVSFEDEPPRDPLALLPAFHFEVADVDHRPLWNFAINADQATEALATTNPACHDEPEPKPAFEAKKLEGPVVRRGDKRFLTITVVRPEPVPDGGRAGDAFRFAITDESQVPLHSFTMNWKLAFLGMSIAYEPGTGL
jgi:hypothetical protein